MSRSTCVWSTRRTVTRSHCYHTAFVSLFDPLVIFFFSSTKVLSKSTKHFIWTQINSSKYMSFAFYIPYLSRERWFCGFAYSRNWMGKKHQNKNKRKQSTSKNGRFKENCQQCVCIEIRCFENVSECLSCPRARNWVLLLFGQNGRFDVQIQYT